MTKITKFIAFILSIITIIPLFAQQNNIPVFQNPHPYRKFQGANQRSIGQSNINIIYQKLNFEVNPSIYYIKGEVQILYKSISSLDSVFINLSNSLIIDSITQRNQQINFSHQNNIIRINVDNLDSNITDSLSIFYQGEPSRSNDAFFISVQDSINYIPVLATLSEPYGASDWWPCKNDLTDKIDSIDINITCPIGIKAVSLGVLESVENTSTTSTYHWKHRYPVTPYLVSIAVSDYVEYHSYLHSYSNNDSTTFLNYLYYNNLEQNKNNIDKTQSFFYLYDSLFIPYAFNTEKYGHVQFPILGGMEHQTISSMGKFDFEIISHELAHQWFGDYITCQTWEDLWLNEGFATYLTGLCYENLIDGYWWPIWKGVTVGQITADSTGTVFPVDTNDISILFDSRLTYRKAAYILHMIRWTIGDDNFFQAIRNYLNNSELSFSYAKTPDLIAQFEQQADTNLTDFMNDWFYGESYPIYNIEWSQDQGQDFHLQLNQTSALNDNHFFRLYVPVQLIGTNDTLNLKLNNQVNHQSYNYDINFIVDTVIFDPDLHLISKNSSTQLNITNIKNTKINIYPNPANDVLIIESTFKIDKIKIIDINGACIKIPISENKINLSSLPKGIYIVNIQTSKTIFTKKIIKE